jgi:hypothetical protein
MIVNFVNRRGAALFAAGLDARLHADLRLSLGLSLGGCGRLLVRGRGVAARTRALGLKNG